MRYKAILFDMDGVILDNEPLHAAAFQATLKNYGHTLTEAQYKDYFAGKTDEEGFRQYFHFIGETVKMPIILNEKTRQYLALATDQLLPYPGVIDYIRDCAARSIPLALVTGSLRAEADIALRAFNLTDCFNIIVAAGDVAHGKPHPEGYLTAAKALSVMPADCIVIEDAPSGIKAARAAGMRCVAVTNTHTKDDLKHATIIISGLRPGCLE